MLYELKSLKKKYDSRTVLDISALTLYRGEVTGLLGPNGAGKTTLLKILAFILEPTSGQVRFEKESVYFAGGRVPELRRKVVLVQQQPILFTSTVYNNVAFPLRIRKIPKAKRERLVEELLDLVGMEPFRHARAHRLSGGETQRVAIARALACSPDVILMDEPTANVDVENQITIERIIQEINRERGISVIFTTHNMIQASRLAGKTIFLFEGRVAKSTYENIFGGHIDLDERGGRYCILQSGLKLKVRAGEPGPGRISIDPGAIKILREKDDSLNNTFRGRLIQLADEHSRVRALVDVGMPLSVLLQKEVFRELNAGMGDTVWLNCPEESIEVF